MRKNKINKIDKINEILETNLSNLKLQYFLDNYQAAAQLATESQMSYVEFLGTGGR
jgi:hypothetical protein